MILITLKHKLETLPGYAEDDGVRQAIAKIGNILAPHAQDSWLKWGRLFLPALAERYDRNRVEVAERLYVAQLQQEEEEAAAFKRAKDDEMEMARLKKYFEGILSAEDMKTGPGEDEMEVDERSDEESDRDEGDEVEGSVVEQAQEESAEGDEEEDEEEEEETVVRVKRERGSQKATGVDKGKAKATGRAPPKRRGRGAASAKGPSSKVSNDMLRLIFSLIISLGSDCLRTVRECPTWSQRVSAF